MRDIKFRAWHKDNNSMVYFDNKKASKDMYIAMNLCALMNGDFGDMLMQYTGLKDKNGVEIYEGDIIHNSNFTDDCNHMVDMIEDIGQWFMIDTKGGYAEPLCDWSDSSVVIGNIHQNPELLGN